MQTSLRVDDTAGAENAFELTDEASGSRPLLACNVVVHLEVPVAVGLLPQSEQSREAAGAIGGDQARADDVLKEEGLQGRVRRNLDTQAQQDR